MFGPVFTGNPTDARGTGRARGLKIPRVDLNNRKGADSS